jgi:cytochrome c peroxidase
MKKFLYLFIITSVILIVSCTKDTVSSNSIKGPKLLDHNYMDEDIPGFTGFFTTSQSVYNESIILGRVLFYDDALSFNGKNSCGSCHLQSKGFADGKVLSDGFLNEKTDRHSMSLVNTRSGNRFFWDGRATNLNTQVLMPIANHIEMGIEDQELLLEKVRGQEYYAALFKDAYGSEEITVEGIGDALAGFVSSLVSYNTKFDQVQNGTAVFTGSEQRGLELFQSTYNCSSCHGGENFNSQWGGTDIANIGLDAESTEDWSGLAKVPSLRNIAVTAPYMHDGRKATLEDVLNHYSKGIKPSPNLDWRLRDDNTGAPVKLNIGTEDKKDLIAFLNTLTDDRLLTDAKYSNPF